MQEDNQTSGVHKIYDAKKDAGQENKNKLDDNNEKFKIVPLINRGNTCYFNTCL
jgi:ubiquitin C-terminal hydrolase